ncbi:FxLYD domain-containing protein [Microcoleus vaginatus GB1-A2]|uniref:FxLYD domain-containing protein n=1 Tax=Microcoleus vaginatus TaxID=119532 RepID=UPI0032A783B8
MYNFLFKNMIILPLTLALSSLLMSPISARPLLTDFTNTLAQNSPVDEPFCYIKTPDGQTVDLGKLCEKQPASGTAQTCIPGSNIAAKVSIAAANYDGNFFSGQVLNQGCKTIKNVKVNYEVLDESGNLIDNGFIYAEPVTLAPGQSAAFRGAVVAGAKVQATHADAQE